MRQMAVIAALAVLAVPAMAQGFRPATGTEIRERLTGHAVQYESTATQDFRASGKTLYVFGSPSWGNWRVEGDQYCSQWPPAGDWACYLVEFEAGGPGLRFVDERGNATTGVFAE